MIRKKIIFAVVAAIAGVFIALLLCEICLRIWVALAPANSPNGFVRFAKQHTYNFDAVLGKVPVFRESSDSSLGWEPVPNSRMAYIRINDGGFRGPDYDRNPAADVTRIVFLGDSETYGERLQEQDTVPGQLQIALKNMNPSGKYEVLNFGVIGYNTSQEYALLEKKGLDYHPSIVVLYYCFNDTEIASPISLANPGVFSRSLLYQFVTYSRHAVITVGDIHHKSRNIAEYYNALHSSIYFDAVKNIIRRMGDELAARNIRFYLLIAPEIYDVKNFHDAYPYYGIHQKLAALRSEHVQVIDPLPAFAARFDDPKKLWVTPFDPHKNQEANSVVASVMANAILGK